MIDEKLTILFDISEDADYSQSFQIPDWAVFVGIYVPTITNANLVLEVSLDDSTFVPVIDLGDGQDLIIVASSYDPCYVDVSDHLRSIPRGNYVRIASSASQLTTDKSLTVFFRG